MLRFFGLQVTRNANQTDLGQKMKKLFVLITEQNPGGALGSFQASLDPGFKCCTQDPVFLSPFLFHIFSVDFILWPQLGIRQLPAAPRTLSFQLPSVVGDRKTLVPHFQSNLIAHEQGSVGSRMTSVQTLSRGGVRTPRSTRTEGQGRNDFTEEGRMDTVSRDPNVRWRLVFLVSEKLP